MRKFARFLIALVAIVFLAASVIGWYTSREDLPLKIHVATGKKGGLNHTFASRFAELLQERTGRPVIVMETKGTEENVQLLREGKAELAVFQTHAVPHDGVVGIAPLFMERVHFIARKSKKICSVAELSGRRVALGAKGSAMRQNALLVLAHHGLAPGDLQDVEEPFGALDADPNLDAAFVTTGWMNPLLIKRLRQRDVELISIADTEALAMRHPWFTATTIPGGLYPDREPIPEKPVSTVGVMALLACRADTPDRLVQESMAALYETDLRATFPAALSAKVAKDFDAVVMHRRVALYHNPSAGLSHLSRTMDFFVKTKEILLGILAFSVLVWNWYQRRIELFETAADQVQKQQLEGFIQQTLDVELEQMSVSGPEELRVYLRRVTAIKQEALKALTRERVRGDQLFAIFLAQCAALSEKIQMRMMYGKMSGTQG